MFRVVVTMLIVLSSLPFVVRADEPVDAAWSEARRHYDAGSRAYDVGQFDEAAREFTEAYKLKSLPSMLYNLGQAHRGAGHIAEALHAYRSYLIKVPDAENRDEVERTIATLEAKQAASAQVAPPAVELVVRAPAPEKPRRRRWVVPVAVVGGMVAVGLAVGLGVGLGVHEHDPHADQTVHVQ